MRSLPQLLRIAARHAARHFLLVLRYRQFPGGYARLPWRVRKRLDLAVLLAGLRRPGAWRAALFMVAALALVQWLRGRWSLDAPGWQLGQCLIVLTALPAIARERRRILRQLLSRGSRRAGG